MAFRKGNIPWNKGKKLPPSSEETRKKLRLSHSRKTGERARNWKGGITKHSSGYILIFKPDHLYSQKSGYINRSRLVIEQHLGRYLKFGEITHHKNGIKDDDRPENIEVITQSKHTSFHNKKREGNRRRNTLG